MIVIQHLDIKAAPWSSLSLQMFPSASSVDYKVSHDFPWWRHQMKTFSALLALCAGNSPVTGIVLASHPCTCVLHRQLHTLKVPYFFFIFMGIFIKSGILHTLKFHLHTMSCHFWLNLWSPGNSPHKGQWRGALMFSLICVWINGWVNNREAGELRRHRAHYDVTVMPDDILPKQMMYWCIPAPPRL